MAQRTLGKEETERSVRARRHLRKEADARAYARHLRTNRPRERHNGLLNGRIYSRHIRTAESTTRQAQVVKAVALKIPRNVQRQIERHIQRAESLSIIQYIPQIPGVNTKFLFQSPYELEMKKAIAKAARYDHDAVRALRVRVAHRFKGVGNRAVAFEWVKSSGDPVALNQIGKWAGLQSWGYAEHIHYRNSFFDNEQRATHFRQGIIYLIESGNRELAKEMGVAAIKRHAQFGDSQMGRSIL